MKSSHVAVLTSSGSWFEPHARKLVSKIREQAVEAELFHRPQDIPDAYEIVFILGYYSLVPSSQLEKHRHNLVVHESDLPSGRGWSPLFWQVLEGKQRIPIVLFEAVEDADAGPILRQARANASSEAGANSASVITVATATPTFWR